MLFALEFFVFTSVNSDLPPLWRYLAGEVAPPIIRTNFGGRPFRFDVRTLFPKGWLQMDVRACSPSCSHTGGIALFCLTLGLFSSQTFWRVELPLRLGELFPQSLTAVCPACSSFFLL